MYMPMPVHTFMYIDLFVFSLLGLPFGNGEIPEKLCSPFKLRIIIQRCADLRLLKSVFNKTFPVGGWGGW